MLVYLYNRTNNRPDILSGSHWTTTAKELWCSEDWLLKRIKEQEEYIEDIKSRRIDNQWSERQIELISSAIDISVNYESRLRFLRTGLYLHEIFAP